jgi:diguanylate cyclase (GGDEF)-like protein
VGLLILIRGRISGRDRAGLIDAAIIATGLGLLSWTFLMKPIAADPSLSLPERLISLAYPLGDVLLLVMVARLVTSPGARTAAYRLLGLALVLLLAADVGYAALNLVSSYEGGLVDAGWLLSYVVWGAAALHPFMRSMSEVAPDQATRFTHWRLTLLAMTSLMAPAVLAEQGLRHQPIDVAAIVLGSVVLFLLVVLRMAGLVAQVQGQATQLAALAHNDALTGIPNRRAWELELPREMARVRRNGGRLHVALLDLDHFKRYNDQHGHQGGDRLLKETTAAWRTRLRQTDLLARYGGEEFAVLLRDCSHVEAVMVLDDLGAVTPAGQTFSAGVAEWDGHEDPERLVGRADRALYEAKHAGRDRIIQADAQPGHPEAAAAETQTEPASKSPPIDTKTR